MTTMTTRGPKPPRERTDKHPGNFPERSALDGLNGASLLRPPRFPADHPITPGAVCSQCEGTEFWTGGVHWNCEACHPSH